MQGDIVEQGVELMLFGMGTVVIFLALLVLATGAMSRLVERYFPEPVITAPPRGTVARPRPGDDPQVVAVISAAIQRHRANKK